MSNQLRSFPLILDSGERAELLSTSRFLDDSKDRIVRMQDGREFLVPRSALEPMQDGSFRLRLQPDQLDNVRGDDREPARPQQPLPSRAPAASAEHARDSLVIPVIEEELEIGRRQVETGRIRVHKRVETRNVVFEDRLLSQGYDINRVPVDRIIPAPLEPRYEGDTLVLPVFEEVLVVEKRLILREEIRITRQTTERIDEQNVPVRREVVEVERLS